MAVEPCTEQEPALVQALTHLRHALELLDAAEAPAQIAAHVDLALNQLTEAIASGWQAAGNERRISD